MTPEPIGSKVAVIDNLTEARVQWRIVRRAAFSVVSLMVLTAAATWSITDWVYRQSLAGKEEQIKGVKEQVTAVNGQMLKHQIQVAHLTTLLDDARRSLNPSAQNQARSPESMARLREMQKMLTALENSRVLTSGDVVPDHVMKTLKTELSLVNAQAYGMPYHILNEFTEFAKQVERYLEDEKGASSARQDTLQKYALKPLGDVLQRSLIQEISQNK